MAKTKKTSFSESIKSFKKDPLFYENLTVLKAQEKIAELMEDNNISKTKLANLLKQPEAYITEMLSDGHNLTLRTFARVCFHLNAEINFLTDAIEEQSKSADDSDDFDKIMKQAMINAFCKKSDHKED